MHVQLSVNGPIPIKLPPSVHVMPPQGAQLMAKFGVNVPEGIPAFSVADVKAASDKMADEKGEVCSD